MMHISSVAIYTGCSAQSEEACHLIEQYYLTDLLGGLEISCPVGSGNYLLLCRYFINLFACLNDIEEKGYY